MDLLNYDFKEKKDEDNKILNDLIYENITLWNNYGKLILENIKLRQQLEDMKKLYKRISEETVEQSYKN